MANEEVNPGSFPVLNDGIYGEVTTAVHEIPCEGLREIDRFCLASESKVSLFFMAVWSLVLRQYTEADILCFGINGTNVSPQDTLDKNSEQDTMLACQVTISPETYVRDLLKNQRDQIRVITGEQLSTNNTGVVFAGKGSSCEPTAFLDRWDGNSDYELLLVFQPNEKAPKLSLVYRTSILSDRQAANVASTVAQAIEQIFSDPDRTVHDLDLFSPQNRRDISRWNNKTRLSPAYESVVDVIRKQALDRPQTPALVSWDGELTYAELDTITSQLAHQLRQSGVDAGVLVPFIFEKSLWAIVAELAILKAGGGFVPLDPALPIQRLKNIIQQTDAKIGLASEKYSPLLKTLLDNVVTVSKATVSCLPKVGKRALPPIDGRSPAYVLFTSGSTGQPKGCLHQHSTLAESTFYGPPLKIRPDSRVLQFGAYSFAISMIEIFCALTIGATLCTPSDGDRLNNLAKAINEMQVTWAMMTPSTANSIDLQKPIPLKTLALGGEPMTTHHLRTWVDKVQLIQAYGMSEWGGACSMSHAMTIRSDIKTIGSSPTANMWLVDPTDHNKLAPVGAVAELLLEGPSLARGYLNNPTRTAAVFIEDPKWLKEIRPNGHGRLYKTGDLVQYQSDGTVLYIARKDTQVKIRGKRLELGEVEYHVRQSCARVERVIAEAAPPADANSTPVLVAFIYSSDYLKDEDLDKDASASMLLTSSPDTFLSDVATIRSSIQEFLPDHMWPSVYVPLRSVPLTITGKADRRKLRETIHAMTRHELETYNPESVKIVPPLTDTETKLHGLFARTLNLDLAKFGIHHSFLRLGGDSILAMRLANACQAAKLPLTVEAILEDQTIAKLAARAEEAQPTESLDGIKASTYTLSQGTGLATGDVGNLSREQLSELGLSPDDVEDAYACSPIQEGILLSQGRNPSYYQVRCVWQIVAVKPGQQVNVNHLQEAWRMLIEMQPMLRTIFVEGIATDSLAMQVILKQRSTETPVVQCSDANVHDLALQGRFTRRDSRDSLPQLTVYESEAGKVYVVLDISHALFDGMSMSIMMRDLALLYDNKLQSSSRLDYRNYVAYLFRLPKKPALDFWTSYLASCDPCVFPKLNASSQSGRVYPDRLHTAKVDVGSLSKYHRFCEATGITLANIFKMAWGLVLRSFTGSNNVCFGYMTAGRDAPIEGIENIIGPFINMMVCHIDLSPDSSILQVLQGIQSDFVRALPHQRVSLAELQHASGLGADTMFNTSMTFVPQVSWDGELDPTIMVKEVGRYDPTEYDILVEVGVQEKDLYCTFKYWEQFLSIQQATTVASTFSHALSMILDRSQQNVRQVELFSPNDEIQVAKWNSEEPERIDRCAHDLIQERCRAQPDAPAICAWDGNLTYGELDDLTSCLAQHLRRRGVGRGVFVPLCFAKSRWTTVAVLGVIKAGGAFVLMDPSHPVDRLREICESVHARLTLVSPEHASMASQLTSETLVIGGQQTEWRETSTCAPLPLVSPNDALYAVFTSGSTGKPKGIIMEHGAFCAGAISVSQVLNLHAQSRVFQFSAYAFDVSVSDTLMPLMVGACVCVPSDLDRRENLTQVMNDLQVTWLETTPTVARLLQPDLVPILQTLVLAGEPMLPSDVLTWAPHLDLRNLYGPAECAVSVTWRGPLTTDCDAVGIGRATKGATTWVVDASDHEKLVPIGAVGELVIEGPVVARGYIHNQCQITPPFIHPPAWRSRFRSKTNGPFYKTGDLVQYAPDGSIRFLGRKDTQAKLNGQRIELGEVEYHVREQFPDARDVIAEIVKPRGQDVSPVLVAFVYAGSAEAGEIEEKQDGKETTVFGRRDDLSFQANVAEASFRLGETLPSYMLPSVFVPLVRIPMTKTGKTDRKLLRQLAASMSRDELDFSVSSKTSGKEPATEMERKLQLVFAQTLGLASDKVWADSHFFRLGGDSVMAMKLVAAARKESLKISVFDIFNRPQLCDLAAAVQDSVNASTRKTIPAFSLLPSSDVEEFVRMAARKCDLLPESIEDIYPCTALQEGLISLTAKKTGMYTAQFVYQIPPEVRWDWLKTAWQTTVDANVILRTRIIQTESYGSFQVVSRRFHIDWFQGFSVDQYLADDAAKPMELGQPLVRFAVFSPAEGVQPSSVVVTLHHALYDGLSFPLLVNQVKAAYHGQQLEPCPFNAFIKYITSQDSKAVQDFWLAEFADLDAPIFPPVKGTTRNPSPTKSVRREVDVKFSNRGATLSNVIRLAWAIVVSHYTDSDDVVFGVTVTGRSAEVDNIEQLSGPTFATFPFRVRVCAEEAVETALEDIQGHATKLIPFEQTGLQRIRRMGPEAAAACNFQSQVSLQIPWKEDDSDGRLMIPQTDYSDYSAFASYAFVLICSLTDNDSLDVLANFDPSIVEPYEAERLIAQFAHVLQQLCTHPEGRIREVEVVSPQDIEQLSSWNSALPEPCEHTIHDLVLRQCSRRPGAPAISSWDRKLTFSELEELSAQLAQELVSAGVRPGSLVPVCFEKSIWPVVAMFAVLRAGGACVNIDHTLPTERIKVMLQDIQPTVIVASADKKHLVESSVSSPVSIITVPSVAMQNPPARSAFMSPSVTPRDAAFIIFTSGSTGKPKAIIMEHVNLSTSIRDHSGPMNVGPDTRTLHFAAYAFDASIYEIFTTLVNGGCVCIPSESDRMSNLAGFIRDHQVNWALLTPSAVTTLQPRQVPDLKTIVLGGEAVTQDNVNTWASKVSLINGYGPAETTICAAGGIPQLGWRTGTIGPIVGGVGWVTVPSDPSRLAPLGAVGELLIEGPVVARGYLNDPAKTKAGFIDTPPWLQRLRPHGPGRVYRSGDLVQFNSDGWIRFIGRKDTQVKLRGQRIELGEIEHHVRTHFQGAREAIAEVIRRGTDRQSSLLVAFIFCGDRSGEDVEADELFSPPRGPFHSKALTARAMLQDLLPPYMVPSVLLPLSHVPLTKTGKIDRRRLREEAATLDSEQLELYSGAATQLEKRAPETDGEKLLQKMWSRVLDIPLERIGVDDHFFHLGGESIAAMRLVGLVRQEGWELSVADIFDCPRLAAMASVMKTSAADHSAIEKFSLLGDSQVRQAIIDVASHQCPVDPDRIEDIYPCTSLQEGLMALTAKKPGAYTAVLSFSMPAGLDISRLQRAWNETAQAHPILRTRIIQAESEGSFQVVLQEELVWEEYHADDDLPDLKANIGLGMPLIRLAIVDRSKDSIRLVLALHHAVYDGWSLPLLLSEVEKAYQGAQLQPQPFSPFVAFLSQAQTAAAGFWKEELADVEAVTFPALPSAEFTPRAESTMCLTIALKQVGKEDFTISTKLRLAWAIVVSQYTNTGDVVFGETMSGRGVPVRGIEHIVGPTIATAPTRIRVDMAQPVTNALQAVQDRSVKALQYEHMGLQYISRLGASPAAACRFQTLVVIQPDNKKDISNLFPQPESLSDEAAFTTYAVLMTCQLSRDAVEVHMLFDDRVMEQTQMRRILEQFEHIFMQLSAEPDAKISELDLLPLCDLKQLAGWTQLPPVPDLDHGVHDLIHRKSLDQPNAVAVSAWDGTFTYEQLDSLSSKLARQLRQFYGVGPEIFVPVYFEKSRWTVVAQLAVMKAGGAFVLLDATQPLQRLHDICQDVQATVIVASQEQSKSAAKLAPQVAVVDEDLLDAPSCEDCDWIPGSVSPDNALYAVFTSGSTGKPKGVVIEHRSYYTTAVSRIHSLGMNEESRYLQFAGYGFDACIMEHLETLLAGGCICIPSEFDRKNRLAEVANEMQVNISFLTPAVTRSLRPEEIPTLRTLMVGGEAVTQDIVETWASHVFFSVVYGPSECSVISSIPTPLSASSDPRDIGRGSGCVCWIVDKDDPEKLLPIGAVGELVLEGDIVGRGYLNNPEKTAASFIKRPKWLSRFRRDEDRKCRLYRTGDLVRYTSEGTIYYIGRKDTQVKLRGQRIELSEVEHHVRQSLPRARETIAEVVSPHDGRPPMLVSFVLSDLTTTGESGEELFIPPTDQFLSDIQEAEARLNQRVPTYMVPALFIPLSVMPLNKNGKVDRRLLREQAASLSREELQNYSSTRGEKRAPSTHKEAKLQQIWAQVLNLPSEDIGVNDNFFRIGGDSIVAMRLVTVARQHGLHFTVPEVFEHPQLCELALVVKETMRTELWTAGVRSVSLLNVAEREQILHQIAADRPFQVADIVDVLPITEAQRTFIQWCVCYIIEIPGQLDLSCLETAIGAVLEKYSILRTVFLPFRRAIAQIVLRQADIQLLKLTTDKDMTLFTDSVCQQQCRSFAALGSPHFQPIIISHEKSDRHSLVLRMSHAQYDGFSLSLLLNDIATAYEGRQLVPAPGFSEYMAYRAEQISPAVFQFWRELLQGSSMTTLQERVSLEGLDDAHTQTQTFVEREIRMPDDIPEGITMATINKAAWSIVLARLTSQNDLVFGQVVAGRNIPMDGVENILGPCCNFLPVRVTIQHDMTVRGLLNYVQNQHSSQMAFETADFRDIVAKSTPWPQDTRLGSLIQYVNFELDKGFSLAGVPCSFRGHAKDILWRGVYIRARSQGGSISLNILSNSGVIDNETAARLLGQQCQLIGELAANPDKLVSALM